MIIEEYIAPNTFDIWTMVNHNLAPNHNWKIGDVSSDEYLDLAAWLGGMEWQGEVKWFPLTFPILSIYNKAISMLITASDDRDAMMIKMAL